MKRAHFFIPWLALLSALLILPNVGLAQNSPYKNHNALSKSLRDLQRSFPRQIRLGALARSANGNEVWLASVGAERDEQKRLKRAVLIVGGVEGTGLADSEACLAIIKNLCEKPNEIAGLSDTVVYVIPRLNPDGAEAFFQSPKMERAANLTPIDDDHDGMADEDGPDDLNGDGMISWMRVQEVEGDWIQHPDDARIMIEADASKGETGQWKLLREGKDNDADEEVNEDEAGGVNFNQNFPYDFPWFEPHAGVNPVYENETRALAGFIASHPNIAAVFTFAGNSNLLKKPESGESSDRRDPQTKIRNEDAAYYDYFGGQWRELNAIEKEIETDGAKGSLVDWLYFHRGLFSFSAPLWSIDIASALKKDEMDSDKDGADDEKNDGGEKGEKSKDDEEKDDEEKDDRAKEEIEYVKWITETNSGEFIEWTKIDHPDFPGKIVEIGGFAPFATLLPPADKLESISNQTCEFINTLISRLPKIEIGDVAVKDLGNGVWDLRVDIVNSGYLPTLSAHGERTGEIAPTRIVLGVEQNNILAGEQRAMIAPIGGGDAVELHYVIRGTKDSHVSLEAISALAGSDATSIQLTNTEAR